MLKIIKTRVQQKHATETEWNNSSFVPLFGEIIIYDADDNYSYPRVKIGDGQTYVTELPFLITMPIRGVDYWTEEDIAEIKSYVDTAILTGEW